MYAHYWVFVPNRVVSSWKVIIPVCNPYQQMHPDWFLRFSSHPVTCEECKTSWEYIEDQIEKDND